MKDNQDMYVDMDRTAPFKKLLANVITNASRPSPTRLSSTPDYKEKKVDLTVDYLMHLFYDKQDSRCYWLDIELNPAWIFQSYHPLSLSVDRLEYHYTKGSVVICSRFANLGRNNCPDEEFTRIIKYIKSQWGWEEFLLDPPMQKELFRDGIVDG